MIAIKMCPIDGTSILPTMAGQQSSIPGVDSRLMRKDVKDMPWKTRAATLHTGCPPFAITATPPSAAGMGGKAGKRTRR